MNLETALQPEETKNPLSRNDAIEMGSARALACRGRRPRRPQGRVRTSHHAVTELGLHSDRRGADRDTRGRVGSPSPTEDTRLSVVPTPQFIRRVNGTRLRVSFLSACFDFFGHSTTGFARSTRLIVLATLASFLLTAGRAAETAAEVKSLSVNGGLEDGKARLVIEAVLKGLSADREKLLFSTALQHTMRVTREKLSHSLVATIDVLQGEPKELTFTIAGEGEILQVSGEGLLDWSVRQETNRARILVLRPRKLEKPGTPLTVQITAEREWKSLPGAVGPLVLVPTQPALFHGYVQVTAAPDLEVQAEGSTGLVPIDLKFLPAAMRPTANPDEPEPLAFRFHGAPYALPLKIGVADPEARRIVLRDFRLVGQLGNQTAAFTLNAVARVRDPQGGSLVLLSGGVALSQLNPQPDRHLRFEQGRFIMRFDRAGEFPVELKFHATVRPSDNGSVVDFRVAPSALQPIALEGLAADTQLEFAGAARPERVGGTFASFLPPDGTVRFTWKEARAEAEAKLFYAAEMLAQISVSPGLMRQATLLDFKIMQGELSRIALLLRGPGEVTRVQGDQVLAWNVEPGATPAERRLTVQFNQPQKDHFALQVQMQTPLGAFPQTAEVMQLRPEAATRFAGFFRIVNEGAVRLEIAQASGLSQISPEQFPENETTKNLWRSLGSQRFAYRFAGAEFALRIQADQIQPELSVSQLLVYNFGENELTIDAEIELDIREAPLRELLLHVPKGFAIARLTAPALSDYFLREPADQTEAELRVVYSKPVSGREVLQLRLERNQALGSSTWALPRIEVNKAKSVRGFVAVSADAGFRLTPERTQALTDIATAFVPRKIPGIQVAFRLSEPSWQATLRVERLPQTVQSDVLHLFSIGEGIAYGSSVINFAVSGAPMSAFKVELSDEYFNVEFTGKDIRNWQKTTNGFLVQLHTPVAGAYTLLATYERPFKAQGEALTFTGARPLDAQSEQGHTLVISAYQFQVTPAEVSPGLLPLETGEVPPEYRLFFDAPILAAYRYTSRPFNLRLTLSPLTQGDSLSQVVDRASLLTRISKEGQVLTDVRYFVKNRGHTHFRMTLPEGTELWSASANGSPVVPVTDTKANLLPLPPGADPNALITLDVKLAARSKEARRVTLAAPIVAAPVMLAEWKLEPDTDQRLVYRKGSLTPVGGVSDDSGFAQLARVFKGDQAERPGILLFAALALTALGVMVWRWSCGAGVYRYSLRQCTGVALGLIALALALAVWIQFYALAEDARLTPSREITFVAPVQQAGSALSVEVENLEGLVSIRGLAWRLWPVLAALAVWGYGWLQGESWRRSAGSIAGWTLLAWAALRWPNGVPFFLGILGLFLFVRILVPAVRRLSRLPRKPRRARPTPPPPPSPSSGAAAAVALWVGGLMILGAAASAADSPALGKGPASSAVPPAKESPLADAMVQRIRIEDRFALATGHIRWPASKGQLLPVVYEPAVVTRLSFPTNALKLIQAPVGSKRAHQLLALETGLFEVEVQYQIHVVKKESESGMTLPNQFGLVNQLELTLVNLDVDVFSPQAVSIERAAVGSNTVAKLILAPVNEATIAWKPRSRDVTREKAVFYAEWSQLYVPAAGVIEGVHYAAIRPAQGELRELVFEVPAGATITDVVDPAKPGIVPAAKVAAGASGSGSLVALWRFDPDSRQLRVSLNPAQSRPFGLLVRSQVATSPLPYERSVGLVSVAGAAGQIGLLGVATSPEVQLDTVNAEAFSPINLEDFPTMAVQSLATPIPGLTVRRAFRYADPKAMAGLKASAVEPDVRVESQDTLSLGEDRTVLAANATVDITRAGIFRLSFVLPAGLDVESISGQAMSHWTEARSEVGRVITVHFRGRTEGQQQFAISLSGPGVKATNAWSVPQLVLREATKQRGTLVIVPEQGMRLQVSARSEVTQLDPQKSGIRQKGVLAFRILQVPWSLKLDIEQVDPWIQVTSLQHATVSEALVKVAANLQYQIENTGLKSFRIWVATNAASVRFQGEQLADFLPISGSVTNGLQAWEVKLHRRVIGRYLLQLTYQTPVPAQAPETLVRGVLAAEVNLQRGFVTLQSGGRLQMHVEALPAALQPTEWQSIPKALQQDLPAISANLAYRLVEPAFQLPLKFDRHEAAKLLPARVNSVTLTSVVSDDGVMLTQVRLELLPGDKRLLHLTLPKDARFWFAFVNQNGVWPWREQDRILIPLEPQARTGQAIPVELFYSSQVGASGARVLDWQLAGPKFDLPLENITWQVYLNEKWHLRHWTGTLQLQAERAVAPLATVNLQAYLQNEATVQKEKTREAEEMLAFGNSLLDRGDPQQARRAFQSAFGLSQHDNAFNEDARVQLNNLKVQQALVGLNVRQAVTGGKGEALTSNLRDLRNRKDVNYTQQDAKQIIDRNSADENAAFMRLAERLIQQQDAATSSPGAIRASIPKQSRLLTFKRAVAVDTWADLKIGLQATAARAASWGVRVLILAGLFVMLALLAWAARSFRNDGANPKE